MPRFIVALNTKGSWEIHKEGCADVAKKWRRMEYNGKPWVIVAESAQAAAEKDCDEELREMGYTPDDWEIFPCCKEAV